MLKTLCELIHAAPDTAHALLLMFGMLGVAIGAFQWTVSPWFVRGKQVAAGWLVDRDILWPLADSPAAVPAPADSDFRSSRLCMSRSLQGKAEPCRRRP